MNTFHRCIILCMTLMLLPGFSASGQKFGQYDVSDGLPSNHVYRITQDAQGFIWAITDKGMARFNGSEFRAYTTRNGLPKNDIWDICQTRDQRIWYFTKAREIGYISGDSVKSFPSRDTNTTLFPSIIHQYDNDIFFSYNNQSFHFGDSLWIKIDEQNSTPKAEVTRYLDDRDSIKDYIRRRGEQTFLIRVKDSLGFLLFKEGYTIINFGSQQVFEKKYPPELITKNTGLFRFHPVDGQIQLTGPDFVSRLDSNYDLVEMISVPENLESHFSMMDRSGNIWIATFSNGMYKLPQVKRTTVYSLNGQKIHRINQVDGDLYASVYGKGFFKYDRTSGQFESYIERDDFVYEASRPKGFDETFFTTSRNVLRLDPDTGSSVEYPAVARKLISFNERLYGYVSSGLNRLDPDSCEILEHYPQVGIKSMEIFKEQLYMATSSGLKVLKEGRIETVGTHEPLLQNPLLSIEKFSDTRLLVATDGFGVYITDLSAIEVLPNSEFTSVQDMYLDEETLWLASEDGILEYDRSDSSFDFKRKWTSRDGLPSRNINSVYAIDRNLIVATDNGMAVITRSLIPTEQKVGIYIDKASYGGSEIVEGTGVSFTKNGSADFRVATIDFTEAMNGAEIQYMLEPVQKEWITSNSSSINFSGLQPASYVLQVRSGAVSSSYKFKIAPLWWQLTITRLVITAIIAAMLFWLLFRLRKYELSKRTAKLEIQKKLTEFELSALRSQMNPHFVFNSLAAIQYCINKNDMKTAEMYLLKFSTLVRQFFEISEHNEVPLDEEIRLLTNYLDIEKLRFHEKLDFEVHLENTVDIHKRTIPTMLLQPIVENAVNHGIFNKVEKGKIDIRFTEFNGDSFKVEVADDGIGYQASPNKLNGKRHSSQVLADRIYFLNRSGDWNIEYSRRDAFPNRQEKGNIATFVIRKES